MNRSNNFLVLWTVYYLLLHIKIVYITEMEFLQYVNDNDILQQSLNKYSTIRTLLTAIYNYLNLKKKSL